MAAAVKAKSGSRSRKTSPTMPAPERPGARFITVDAAAEMLKLHPMSVRKLIGKGTIPAVRIGRAVRVDVAKLDEGFRRQLEAQAQGKRT